MLGMLEFIPSEPLSNIIAVYGGDLLTYLSSASDEPSLESLMSSLDLASATGRPHLPPPSSPAQVAESVLDNYIRSCGTIGRDIVGGYYGGIASWILRLHVHHGSRRPTPG